MKAHADAARLLIAGTSRTPVPPQATLAQHAPAALAPLLARVGEGASDESRLWQTLAALDWTRRAGFTPAPQATAAPEVAAPDRLAPCGTRAEALLRQMLGGLDPQLIAEWLLLAARHGGRIPHGLLPALLDLGARAADLRPAIRAAADERGRWLARLNPRWHYVRETGAQTADTSALQQLWDTGGPEERAGALQRWRELAPDAARAALEAGWKSEAPETRAKFLRLLATGLAGADEAFLETALDDKRKEVRGAAAELLQRLTGSALVARMRERVAALVKVESRLLLGKKLTVELPGEATKAMQRDGAGRDKRPRLGEKAAALADMVAALPLAHWSALLDAEPAKALDLLLANEHREAFVTGLTEACLRDPAADSGWTLALLARWLKMERHLIHYFADDFPSAALGLPPAQAEAALLAWVRESPRQWRDDEPVAVLLAHTVRPGRAWGRALSLAVIERLGASRAVLRQPYSMLRGQAQNYAYAVDPGAAAEYEVFWPGPDPDDTPAWTRMQDEFLGLARRRHDLTTSFTGEPHGQ